MDVRLNSDWEDDDGVLHRAGDVVNVDPTTAANLSQWGKAEPSSGDGSEESDMEDGWGKSDQPDY